MRIQPITICKPKPNFTKNDRRTNTDRTATVQDLYELEERIFGGKKVKSVQGISRELMQDLQNDIKESIDKLLGQKRDLLYLMEMMPKAEMRTVLSLRYLNSKRWEDVAKTMNRPLWDVFGIHSKIIEFLENKFSY